MSIQSIDPLVSTARRSAKRSKRVIVRATHKRSAQQVIAAIAAGFLPVASYVIAHVEAVQEGKAYLYGLVVAALLYSAPTLATWAQRWAGHPVKAWAFTILLEFVAVLSHIQWLNLTGLVILVVINSFTAFGKAAK